MENLGSSRKDLILAKNFIVLTLQNQGEFGFSLRGNIKRSSVIRII